MQEYYIPFSLSNQSCNWESFWQTKAEHDSDIVSQKPDEILLPLAENKHCFMNQGQRDKLKYKSK